MATITIKVDENLKKTMRRIKINWSEYIREAIRHRIKLEERRAAAEKLVEGLKSGKPTVPKGFINETLRKNRKN